MKHQLLYLLLVFPFIYSCQRSQTAILSASDQQKLTAINFIESSNDSFSELLKQLESDTNFESASIGMMIINPETKEIIGALNPGRSLVPASVMKILTTGAALEIFGQDFKFKTAIEYDGKIDSVNRVLHGNIYIKGGGDPCLGSLAYKKNYYEPFFINSWVNAVKSLGIDSISGQIIGDAQIYDSEIVPSDWAWVDIGSYYGGAASGLSIYDNVFSLTTDGRKKGLYIPGKDSCVPLIPDVEFENIFSDGLTDQPSLDMLGAYYGKTRVIHGYLPKNQFKFSIQGSVPDPALLAANEFYSKLSESGIKTGGKPTTVRQMISEKKYKPNTRNAIFITESPKMNEIVERTNLLSFNLYAEHLFKHIGYTKTGFGDNLNASKSIVNFYKSKGVNTKGMFISDGSGLSRSDGISANQLVQVLFYLKNKSAYFGDFYKSLPVAGQSGTLVKFGKSTLLEGKVAAKSGSMSRVLNYAGFVDTKKGHRLIFAFMVNNFTCPTSYVKQKYVSYLTRLIENY